MKRLGHTGPRLAPSPEHIRQQLLDQPPQAIIFDANLCPGDSQGYRDIFLRLQKATRGIILVYLGEKPKRAR